MKRKRGRNADMIEAKEVNFIDCFLYRLPTSPPAYLDENAKWKRQPQHSEKENIHRNHGEISCLQTLD